MGLEEERELIRRNPYEYICDYVESIYPKTGKKVFQVLSLMPISLIIPDFYFMGKKIRSNINALFLASSGAGKTSIADLFASLTFSPLKLESITAPKLEDEIQQVPMFSLIVGDFARNSKDHALIKVIEGLLGEEKRVIRKTKRKDIDIQVEGIGLLCGVSTDLGAYLFSGLIFRLVPILLYHNESEHAHIGKHIIDNIGNHGNTEEIEQVVRDYYRELSEIQAGKNKQIERVEKYSIAKKFKDKLYEEWNELTHPIIREGFGFNFFREIQEGIRIMISHAFLNIYNRRVEDGVLYPNEDDFKVALRLMRQTIIFKYRLMKTEKMAKGLSNSKEFVRVMNSEKVSNETKAILRNLVRIKDGRVNMKEDK